MISSKGKKLLPPTQTGKVLPTQVWSGKTDKNSVEKA